MSYCSGSQPQGNCIGLSYSLSPKKVIDSQSALTKFPAPAAAYFPT